MKFFKTATILLLVILAGVIMYNIGASSAPEVELPATPNFEATMEKLLEGGHTYTEVPTRTLDPTSTPFPTNTPPPMSTVTVNPTQGYSNPEWISAFFVTNAKVYESTGAYNSAGNMMLGQTNTFFWKYDEIAVNKNAVQVDGGWVYLIIGPRAAGMYVRIEDVELWVP